MSDAQPVAAPPTVVPAHRFERDDVDRAAQGEPPWERSTAEERDDWWHADWGWSEDW